MTIYVPSLRHLDDGLDDRAYGPTSALSEEALLHGYDLTVGLPPRFDRPVDSQRCACGGVVNPGVASEIAAAVAAHNDTPRHQAWRARRGIR